MMRQIKHIVVCIAIIVVACVVALALFKCAPFPANAGAQTTTCTVTTTRTVAKALDCHVVAEITEKKTGKIRLKKRIGKDFFGVDSFGELEYELDAVYKYFVSWDSFNLTLSPDGSVLAEFPPLGVMEPTYKNKTEHRTRGLSVTNGDIDARWNEFSSNGELAKTLEESAKSYANMAAAEKIARGVLAKVLAERVLPYVFPDIKPVKAEKITVSFSRNLKPSDRKTELKKLSL